MSSGSSGAAPWIRNPPAVREPCKEESDVGRSAAIAVVAVITDRLDSARTRLLDLFAPYGGGRPLAYSR
ncbi:hypothetical protein [Streptomyces sp. NPDC049949]|uniref:hypothetical protein n=1 Tax=Streptomyces sp. NPDC049949 TaxID=3154627 RepID=UPI00341897F2